MTYHDLEQFPDDGNRYELIDGELHVSAAPAKQHQRLVRRLAVLFDAALAASGAGEVFLAPVDVRFAGGSQVQPDLLVIRHERRQIYQGNAVLGAPDVVVEVRSPANRAYDETVKARLYAAHGVAEYWLADPDAPSLHRFVLRDGHYEPVAAESGVPRSVVVPGLVVDPGRLLAGLDE